MGEAMTTFAGPNWKPSRAKRQAESRRKQAQIEADERYEKAQVRRRDGFCRFPLCGCRRLHIPTEVAHLRHKGMGGNPKGDRSTREQMILLCRVRHQDSTCSLHRGTLRIVPLDPARGTDGPVRFEVFMPPMFDGGDEWRELATEAACGVVREADLSAWQRGVLTNLAELDE